jgi:cytochrome c oxidase subunit 2
MFRFSFVVSLGVLALFIPAAHAQENIRRVANIFDPLSAPAEMIQDVSLLVLLICAGIFTVVAGLLVYTMIRFRHTGAADDRREPPQVYGSTQIELAWTVLPILITIVLILVTARTIGEIQNQPMPEDALTIRVVGHQWWWEVHYQGLNIVTANEIHVPVSDRADRRPVRLILESADVIHSFWVPQLNGKTDVVPNRRNHSWIEPYATGIFLGNCAEYCGTQHANMLLRVIVHEQADFDAWIANQQQEPVADANVTGGRELFFSTACINCHRVGGTIAEGVFGPDLTHLMTRDTIGAGVVANTPENLRKWVRDPQAKDMKPGCLMPNMKLEDNEVDEIVAYLLTLK